MKILVKIRNKIYLNVNKNNIVIYFKVVTSSFSNECLIYIFPSLGIFIVNLRPKYESYKDHQNQNKAMAILNSKNTKDLSDQMTKWQKFESNKPEEHNKFNPLMPGCNKKVTHA